MDRQKVLKLLRGGPNGIQRFNIVRPQTLPGLNRANLSNTELSGVKFAWAKLNHVNFAGSRLGEADLSNAEVQWGYLIETSLNHASLYRADFRHADLRGADLHGVCLVGAKLYKTDLRKVDLTAANLNQADARCANLREADLSGADLQKAYLIGADLSRAKLCGANLSGVMLRDANLSWADLTDANLSHADLTRATCQGAQFRKSNLAGAKFLAANLSGARLDHADLRNADLSDADLRDVVLAGSVLTGAIFTGTVIACDLSEVADLNGTKHRGPSHVSIEAIGSVKGNLPEQFLRGCGVAQEDLTLFRGRNGYAVKSYDCFISHSSEDSSFAQKLSDALQQRGIRCWCNKVAIHLGEGIPGCGGGEVGYGHKVLLCASRHMLDNAWINSEMNHVINSEDRFNREHGKECITLIPLSVDGYIKSDQWQYSKRDLLRQRLAADFTGWQQDDQKFQQELEKVVEALRMTDGK